MKPTPSALLATLLSLVFLAFGVGLVLVGLAARPADRTMLLFVGAAIGVPALVSFGFLPGIWREGASGVGPFLPAHPDGRPQQGTPGVQQLAGALQRTFAGSPYAVLTAPDAVRVEWNTGDLRYSSLLTEHRVERVYRTTLTEAGANTFVRLDEYLAYDAATGLLRNAAERTFQSGEIVRFERRVDIALGASGLSVPVDYTLDTRPVKAAVDAAVASVHARVRRSAVTRYAMVWAAIGVVGALAGVLVAVFAVLAR